MVDCVGEKRLDLPVKRKILAVRGKNFAAGSALFSFER